MPVYVGMLVYATRNVRKDVDYVNGMRCVVEGYSAPTGGIQVLSDTGHRFTIARWTDVDLGGLRYWPVRPGYASTIGKFQGAQLEHAVAFLDAPNVPGAAYTAMSRVEYGDRVQLAGKLTANHFTPAR